MIEVCTAYELDGKIIHDFPYPDALNRCKPVFEKVKGWHCDISKCRKKEELPKEALDYIKYIEGQVAAATSPMSPLAQSATPSSNSNKFCNTEPAGDACGRRQSITP